MLKKHQIADSHYYTWNNEKIPSVTKIIKETLSKEAKEKINKWRVSFEKQTAAAVESGKEPPQCPAQRGTNAHEAVYNYFLGQEINNPYVLNARPLLDKLSDSWYYCEEELANVSNNYYYAGTCDLVARYGQYNYVFDWISSDRYKKKEWIEDKLIQAAAYAMAINSNPQMGIKIDRVAAVVLRPDTYQIFTADLSEYDWQWQARYCKYMAGF